MKFRKFFKKHYPYAPVAYLGRKAVEASLDAEIIKYKKLEKNISKTDWQ